MIRKIVLPILLLTLFGCTSKTSEGNPNEFLEQKPSIEQLINDLENSLDDKILVVAHRGDWRNAPENSLQAIQYCIEMGVDMVEIDVRMTKDSVLVLMHDETIDRTTSGSGVISDFTYDSLQNFYLRDGQMNTTHHKIPRLEEALVLSEDKILINLDTKDYQNLPMYYKLLKETNTLDQVLIKASIFPREAESIFGEYMDEIYFMPLIRTSKPNSAEMVDAYMKKNPPVAFEFVIPSDTSSLIHRFAEIRKRGSSVWVNSLQPHHCAGHHDEKAALDISTYDWFIENKVNIIQTDRPALLIGYLKEKGLHN